jgi:hypothetical protein
MRTKQVGIALCEPAEDLKHDGATCTAVLQRAALHTHTHTNKRLNQTGYQLLSQTTEAWQAGETLQPLKCYCTPLDLQTLATDKESSKSIAVLGCQLVSMPHDCNSACRIMMHPVQKEPTRACVCKTHMCSTTPCNTYAK